MERVETKEAPGAIGPYSQAVKQGGFVFASGQLGSDPTTGTLVAGGVEAQAQQALQNMKAIVTAAGSAVNRVVKVTIFLADMNDFAKVNAIYEKFFEGHKPARSTVQVARLPRDAAIEIEAIAALG